MIIYRILFTIYLSLSIISCQLNKNITYINDNIDIEVRKEIENLNNIVFNEANNESAGQIDNLLHSKFRELDNYRSTIKSIMNFLKTPNILPSISIYNEFYSISPGTGERQVHFFSFTDDNYFVSLTAWTPEIYVSLFETKDLEHDALISLVYEKDNGDWKIRNFHIGDRRILGRTYQQWIEEAKIDFENRRELTAYFKIRAAKAMLKPAPFIEYVLDDKSKSFIDNLTNNILSSKKFLIAFNEISSKPEIYSVNHRYIQNTKEVLPVFVYKTKYALSEESLMQNEVDQMVSQLKIDFPGIEKQFSGLIFTATKEVPQNDDGVDYFNLIYKFN